MGHPYNQTQWIEIQNLSAQRFVGTDIQKNLFYGRDLPVLRFEYAFDYKPVEHDYTNYKYDLLTSGDYVKLYLDIPKFKAEHTGIIRGENQDYPLLAPTPSGIIEEFPYDRPLLAPQPSGRLEPSDLDVAWKRFLYTEHDVIYIDYDRPRVHFTPRGGMLGTVIHPAIANIAYVFETGIYYPGDHIPTQVSLPDVGETAARTSYFFYTGRYDGPTS